MIRIAHTIVLATLLIGAATAPLAARDAFVNLERPCESNIELPALDGKWPVGTVTYFWIDETRAELLSPDENDFRQIVGQVFYPAASTRGRAPASYVPELDSMRASLLTDRREMPRTIANDLEHYGCVRTRAYRDAALVEGTDRLPLMLLSPGGNMSRHWHTALAESLASHGYVVVVLSHAFSGMDVFPSGGLLMSDARWQQNGTDDALADMLAKDAIAALDQMSKLAAHDPLGRFEGRLDLTRVALAGHSRGGKTVSRGCAMDSRFGACIIYDNIGPERERATGLDQPQMTIRGVWPGERAEALEEYLSRNRTMAYEVILRDATHFSFSDLPIVDPDHYPSAGDPRRLFIPIQEATLEFLGKVFNHSPAPLLDDPATTVDGLSVRRLDSGSGSLQGPESPEPTEPYAAREGD